MSPRQSTETFSHFHVKHMVRKLPYMFLFLGLLVPDFSFAQATQEPFSVSRTSSETKPDNMKKDPPWKKMNIFAKMTGIWKKSSGTFDIISRKNLPKLIWNSDQGGHLELSMLPMEPLGSAQKISVQVSTDFFSCDGVPLRLWFTTQEYLDLSAPVCDGRNMLSQQIPSSREKKLADIMNHGGFPVLLSQERQAVMIGSLLNAKEIEAIKWYRSVTNPFINKDLTGKEK